MTSASDSSVIRLFFSGDGALERPGSLQPPLSFHPFSYSAADTVNSLICHRAAKHANGTILAERSLGWDETIHTTLLHASFYTGITWLTSSVRMGNYGLFR